MAGVFDKLQLKDQKEIVVLNAPDSFEPELAKLKGVAVPRSAQDVKEVAFSIAFVKTQPEVESAAKAVAAKAEVDAKWAMSKAGMEKAKSSRKGK